MFTFIILALLIVCLIIILYTVLIPKRIFVIRKTLVKAKIEDAFRLVQDFKNWIIWSPFLIYEPDSKQDISEVSDQVNSYQSWDGKYIGAGKTTHLEIIPNKKIVQKIQFFRPFKSLNNIVWEFVDFNDGHIEVKWIYESSPPFFLRLSNLFIEKMLGHDFEVGLSLMAAKLDSDMPQLMLRLLDSKATISSLDYISKTISIDFTDKGALLDSIDQAVSELQGVLKSNNLQAGKSFLLLDWDQKSYREKNLKSQVCISLNNKFAGIVPKDLDVGNLQPGIAVHTQFEGASKLLNEIFIFEKCIFKMRKLKQLGPTLIYLSDLEGASNLKVDAYSLKKL